MKLIYKSCNDQNLVLYQIKTKTKGTASFKIKNRLTLGQQARVSFWAWHRGRRSSFPTYARTGRAALPRATQRWNLASRLASWAEEKHWLMKMWLNFGSTNPNSLIEVRNKLTFRCRLGKREQKLGVTAEWAHSHLHRHQTAARVILCNIHATFPPSTSHKPQSQLLC